LKLVKDFNREGKNPTWKLGRAAWGVGCEAILFKVLYT